MLIFQGVYIYNYKGFLKWYYSDHYWDLLIEYSMQRHPPNRYVLLVLFSTCNVVHGGFEEKQSQFRCLNGGSQHRGVWFIDATGRFEPQSFCFKVTYSPPTSGETTQCWPKSRFMRIHPITPGCSVPSMYPECHLSHGIEVTGYFGGCFCCCFCCCCCCCCWLLPSIIAVPCSIQGKVPS